MPDTFPLLALPDSLTLLLRLPSDPLAWLVLRFEIFVIKEGC
jgi:hypothetical protein